MFKFLQKLLGGVRAGEPAKVDERPAAEIESRDTNPVATAAIMGQPHGIKASAGAWETDAAQAEYQLFCKEFHVQAGSLFIDSLGDAEGKLKAWLHWTTPDAEPKAFVRLMLLLNGAGRSIREEPGLSILLDGRWSQGGGPSAASDEALALLAQVLQIPIKLFFHKTPQEPLWVNEYRP